MPVPVYFSENDYDDFTRKHISDAGADFRSPVDKTIPSRGKVIISTGLYVAIPEGHVGLIWSRSGLAAEFDIEKGAGSL